MSRSQIAVVVLVVLMLVVVLGLIASRLGGSTIRTSGQVQIGQLTLSSEMVLPGTRVTFSYDMLNLDSVDDALIVMVRTPRDSMVIGEVSRDALGSGIFWVTVPCAKYDELEQDEKGRFVLVSNLDQRVLAQSDQFTFLPAGRDCMYQ